MNPIRFNPVALVLTIALLSGCADALTSEPPDAPSSSLLQSLNVEAADLEGVDLDALVGSLDADAIVEAIGASVATSTSAIGKTGTHSFVSPGESIQAAVDAAPAGATVYVRPGVYVGAVTITKSVHLVGLGRPGAVVIQDPGGARNGIEANNVNDISLINLTIRGFSGNGVFFEYVDGFVLSKLFTDQLRAGAYGLYPRRSRNGLIAHCTATGADDAGIYLGQAENVAVVHNEAYGNVIGFEATNVRQTVWSHNRGYENSAGMLAVFLPGARTITVVYADHLTVTHNRFEDNNLPNFAPAGRLAASVPQGTGLLIAGYDDSYVAHNKVTGNATIGIGLISTVTLWLAAGRNPAALATINPHPDRVRIEKNHVTGNGFGPDIALPGFPSTIPSVDLLWDKPVIDLLASLIPGFPFGTYGTGNCWEKNKYDTSYPTDLPTCGAPV